LPTGWRSNARNKNPLVTIEKTKKFCFPKIVYFGFQMLGVK